MFKMQINGGPSFEYDLIDDVGDQIYREINRMNNGKDPMSITIHTTSETKVFAITPGVKTANEPSTDSESD